MYIQYKLSCVRTTYSNKINRIIKLLFVIKKKKDFYYALYKENSKNQTEFYCSLSRFSKKNCFSF